MKLKIVSTFLVPITFLVSIEFLEFLSISLGYLELTNGGIRASVFVHKDNSCHEQAAQLISYHPSGFSQYFTVHLVDCCSAFHKVNK